MKELKIRIHWSFFLLGILMIFFGKIQTFLLALASVLLHEMGHSLVGRKLGYKLNIITLLPYGAMLSGKDAPFSESDEIKIAVAGPFVNAILILLFGMLWWIFPIIRNLTQDFVIANIYTLIFNILPVYPLDGGRILKATLSKRMGQVKAKKITKHFGYVVISIIFGMFFLSFFYELNYMLGVNALFLLIGLLDDKTEVYYEKLTTLSSFKRTRRKKRIEISKNQTLFDAYKKIIENGAGEIVLYDENGRSNIFSKNRVINMILTLPINTKFEKLCGN